MRNVGSILSVSCGYIAAIIGAGFASGQEIISFFATDGYYGFLGIAAACALFSLFSYAVLSVCVERKINTYSEFVFECFSSAAARKTINILTAAFAVSAMCVMTACAGEIGFVLFGVRSFFGCVAFAAVCCVIFLLGKNKIIGINVFLGIIMVPGIIFCCMYILRFREHQVFHGLSSAVISGAAYAGYNLLTAGSMLAGMSGRLRDKKEALISSVISGCVLFGMIVLIWGILGMYCGKINLGEIPMLTMTFRQNNALGIFYSAMLLAAVITTGISNGFGIIDITANKIGRKTAVIFIFVISICFGGMGFSRLIDTAYRICGYGGVVFTAAVIFRSFKIRMR